MTLLARTTARRRMTATVENRARVERVERRSDEIAVVCEVESDYQRADRIGDLQMESWFQRSYQSAPDEEWRSTILEGFLLWQGTERSEERAVTGSVGDAVRFLRENNPYWLADGCGPDGRAA